MMGYYYQIAHVSAFLCIDRLEVVRKVLRRDQPLITVVFGIASDHISSLRRSDFFVLRRNADVKYVLSDHVGPKLGNLLTSVLTEFAHRISLAAIRRFSLVP